MTLLLESTFKLGLKFICFCCFVRTITYSDRFLTMLQINTERVLTTYPEVQHVTEITALSQNLTE